MTPGSVKVFNKAWPIILANASTPLLGLVDTAIVGHTNSTQMLSGLALSVLIFNFVFWACGFLRMSTTGFVAQYSGTNNTARIIQTVNSGLLLSLGLAFTLIALQWPLQWGALAVMQGSQASEQYAAIYFDVRIWGAPATLGLYVINGLLIGLGQTRHLLQLQLYLNGLSALLSVIFGYYLEGRIAGVALGTVCAEWFIFIGACWALLTTPSVRMAYQHSKLRTLIASACQWRNIRPLLISNRDIFLRTLFLLCSFAWFTNASAQLGDTTLAANHILLQFISFSAFFLDAFAFVAEAYIGKSIGQNNFAIFRQSVRITTQWSFFVAVALALSFLCLGPNIAILLTNEQNVIAKLQGLLPYACLYIFLSFMAFQLDGIFIGATQSAAMRNASILSFAGFIVLYYVCLPFGVQGLWVSFIGYVVLRAASLLLFWHKIETKFT